jgi:hypothetical protein
MKWTGLQVDSYVLDIMISCFKKVKPITDEFDKTFEWKSVLRDSWPQSDLRRGINST